MLWGGWFDREEGAKAVSIGVSISSISAARHNFQQALSISLCVHTLVEFDIHSGKRGSLDS